MAEPDDTERAVQRLEAALERIAAQPCAAGPDAPGTARAVAKLDNLIRALRTALDS